MKRGTFIASTRTMLLHNFQYKYFAFLSLFSVCVKRTAGKRFWSARCVEGRRKMKTYISVRCETAKANITHFIPLKLYTFSRPPRRIIWPHSCLRIMISTASAPIRSRQPATCPQRINLLSKRGSHHHYVTHFSANEIRSSLELYHQKERESDTFVPAWWTAH